MAPGKKCYISEMTFNNYLDISIPWFVGDKYSIKLKDEELESFKQTFMMFDKVTLSLIFIQLMISIFTL